MLRAFNELTNSVLITSVGGRGSFPSFLEIK